MNEVPEPNSSDFDEHEDLHHATQLDFSSFRNMCSLQTSFRLVCDNEAYEAEVAPHSLATGAC